MGTFFTALLGSGILKDVVSTFVRRVLRVEQDMGPGGGVFKFQNVLEQVLPMLDQLRASGKLKADAVDQNAVAAILEVVVQVLNSMGLLQPGASTAPSLVGKRLTVEIKEIQI